MVQKDNFFPKTFLDLGPERFATGLFTNSTFHKSALFLELTQKVLHLHNCTKSKSLKCKEFFLYIFYSNIVSRSLQLTTGRRTTSLCRRSLYIHFCTSNQTTLVHRNPAATWGFPVRTQIGLGCTQVESNPGTIPWWHGLKEIFDLRM